MAELERQGSALGGVTYEGNDFASLLKKEFKPKTDEAKEAVERAREMLGRVGLGDRGNSLPSHLSGGQQQRVAIARALVHGPKLIVCDEPTSALDEKTGHTVMELMRDLALENGRALVVVTHDARIFEFADRIAKMNDGRVEKVVTSAKEM